MRWMNLEPLTQVEERENQVSYINVYMWNLERCTDEHIYKEEIETWK